MAYFSHLSEISGDCLLNAYRELLAEAQIDIEEEYSNPSQIYAVSHGEGNKQKTVAKILISWKDKKIGLSIIEVITDEPSFIKGTYCEMISNKLQEKLSR